MLKGMQQANLEDEMFVLEALLITPLKENLRSLKKKILPLNSFK